MINALMRLWKTGKKKDIFSVCLFFNVLIKQKQFTIRRFTIMRMKFQICDLRFFTFSLVDRHSNNSIVSLRSSNRKF